MTMELGDAGRDVGANSIVDAVDGGTGPGKVRIATLAQPTDTDQADVGVDIATPSLADPAFGASANGTASALGLPKIIAVNAGGPHTPGHIRVRDGDAVVIWDGDVSDEYIATPASGWQTGGSARIVATFSVTMPAN